MSRTPQLARFWLAILLIVTGGCDHRGRGDSDSKDGNPGNAALPTAEPGWEAPTGVAPRNWKWIVIHHSGEPVGSYAAIDNYHRDSRGWDGCGYHFVIGNGVGRGSPDGRVEIGERWRQQKHGAHAGRDFPEFNQNGIGICLIGNFDVPAAPSSQSTPAPGDSVTAPGTRPTSAQMDALARLVRYLCWRYQIPRDHVIGHKQVRLGNGPPRNTDCPGRYFSLTDLQARLDVLDGRPTIGPAAPAAVANAR